RRGDATAAADRSRGARDRARCGPGAGARLTSRFRGRRTVTGLALEGTVLRLAPGSGPPCASPWGQERHAPRAPRASSVARPGAIGSIEPRRGPLGPERSSPRGLREVSPLRTCGPPGPLPSERLPPRGHVVIGCVLAGHTPLEPSGGDRGVGARARQADRAGA